MSEREIKIHLERHKAFLEQWADEKIAYKQGYTDGRGFDMNLESRFERLMQKTLARLEGKRDGRNYQMSEPREPRFEDDFDCDTDPQEPMPPAWYETTIEDIAIMKSHIYAVEYDPNAGRVIQKGNYAEIKEAYKAGFLEGFTHRLTQLNTGE